MGNEQLGPKFEGLFFQLLKTSGGIGVVGVDGLQVSRASPASSCRARPAGFVPKPLRVAGCLLGLLLVACMSPCSVQAGGTSPSKRPP